MTIELPPEFTTLHDLLALAEAEWHADRDDTMVTPSAAGTLCRRQLAYRLTGAAPTDEPDPVTVATVGTLLHRAIAPLWDDDPYTLATEAACAGGGTTDVVQGLPGWFVIRDTKTVSRSKFDAWERREGPPVEVWDQLHAYGGRQGGDQQPTLLVVDALCRETGRCATYTMVFDRRQWQEVEAGLQRLADRYSTGDPDLAPADRDGRGDWLCDGCPWATRCLGEDDRPNVTELAPEEAMSAAAEYAHWDAVQKDAKAKADAAKNALRGTTGTYGQWTIGWRDVAPTTIEAYTRKGYKVLSVKEAKP